MMVADERAKEYGRRDSRSATPFATGIPITSKRAASTNFWPTPIWPRATRTTRASSWKNTMRWAAEIPSWWSNWRRSKKRPAQPKKAAAALDRLNYIYPEDQELHKRLGDLWLAQNNLPGAIREYQALLALKPLDQATSHYQLAEALPEGQPSGSGPRRSAARAGGRAWI